MAVHDMCLNILQQDYSAISAAAWSLIEACDIEGKQLQVVPLPAAQTAARTADDDGCHYSEEVKHWWEDLMQAYEQLVTLKETYIEGKSYAFSCQTAPIALLLNSVQSLHVSSL